MLQACIYAHTIIVYIYICKYVLIHLHIYTRTFGHRKCYSCVSMHMQYEYIHMHVHVCNRFCTYTNTPLSRGNSTGMYLCKYDMNLQIWYEPIRTYVKVCGYVYISIHVYTHLWPQEMVQVCMYANTVWTYIYVCKCVQIYLYMYTHTFGHRKWYRYVCMQIRYEHTYIYM